jgi:hypothetical protein
MVIELIKTIWFILDSVRDKKKQQQKSVDNIVNGRSLKASDILSWTRSNFSSENLTKDSRISLKM